jgi:hypothetical protein
MGHMRTLVTPSILEATFLHGAAQERGNRVGLKGSVSSPFGGLIAASHMAIVKSLTTKFC